MNSKRFEVYQSDIARPCHSDSKIRGRGPRRLEECSQVSSNILIVFEKRWERTQKRWEYVKKDGSIHKKRKKDGSINNQRRFKKDGSIHKKDGFSLRKKKDR